MLKHEINIYKRRTKSKKKLNYALYEVEIAVIYKSTRFLYITLSESKKMDMLISLMSCFCFISGLCLYLGSRDSFLGEYNCSHFQSGCPNTSFPSYKLFECKLVGFF